MDEGRVNKASPSPSPARMPQEGRRPVRDAELGMVVHGPAE